MTSKDTKNTIQNGTFSVDYPNGTKVLVGRFKRSKLTEAIQILDELMYLLVSNNFAVGSVIADEGNWSLLKSLAALLPVVGSETAGIDIDDIADNYDYDQIADIFFTTSRNPETGAIEPGEKGWEPSHISRINNLNYSGALKNGLDRLMKESKETKALIEEALSQAQAA